MAIPSPYLCTGQRVRGHRAGQQHADACSMLEPHVYLSFLFRLHDFKGFDIPQAAVTGSGSGGQCHSAAVRACTCVCVCVLVLKQEFGHWPKAPDMTRYLRSDHTASDSKHSSSPHHVLDILAVKFKLRSDSCSSIYTELIITEPTRLNCCQSKTY